MQFCQIITNAIVLVIVSLSLIFYLHLHPVTTSVKYINHTITHVYDYVPSRKNVSQPVETVTGRCSSYVPEFCEKSRVPYNSTILPNFFGSSDKNIIAWHLETYALILRVRCYELAPLFLCLMYAPKCDHDNEPVFPCRSLCQETLKRCGIFFEIFSFSNYGPIDCSLLPSSSSDDPNVCYGDEEVIAQADAEKIINCGDAFKCDERRCIPADWRCDGHVDCEDNTDESNCSQCPGQLHCGMGRCIATEHICDGVIDCPWGQDERNCVRLSERMGDVGSGFVEIFVPEKKEYEKACISTWDSDRSPTLICKLLGYQSVNYTILVNDTRAAVTRTRYLEYENEDNKLNIFRNLINCDRSEHFPLIQTECGSYSCGTRKKSLFRSRMGSASRIIGGTESNPGDWPFLAAILGGPLEVFYCAGVLISDQWILTAAHCIGNFNLSKPIDEWELTIQLGITRRFSHSYFEQKLKANKIILHEQYAPSQTQKNDIALIRLKEKVKFHDHLLPVCLPNSTTVLKPPRKCVVIGWGRTEDGEDIDFEPTVFEVTVPIMSTAKCKKWFSKKDPALQVSAGMVCAGYEHGGKDACQGDSGGPLLCRANDGGGAERWFVAGIVSWGVKCASPKLPGVYTSVPVYMEWIRNEIEENDGNYGNDEDDADD